MPNKRLRSTIEKHPDAAQDYYGAKKMTKVKEQKVSDYLSDQISRMGLNSTQGDVFVKIHKERSRKPPTRAPGFKSGGRNLELHLLNSAEEIAKERSMLMEELNKNSFDKGCVCELQEEITERQSQRESRFEQKKRSMRDSIEINMDSPMNS